MTLAVLLWREPTGLWPASWLTLELVIVAWLGRASPSPAFVLAVPFLAFVVIIRVVLADDDLARVAAGSLLTRPMLSARGRAWPWASPADSSPASRTSPCSGSVARSRVPRVSSCSSC